jgi:CHASE3 domain sensor protein
LIRQEKTVDIELGRATRGTILVGFALLVLACLGAIVVALSGAKAEQAATHSLQVRGAQALLFSTVQDAETGQRGYLLTGDSSYLAPFNKAQDRIPELKSALSSLTVNDLAQQRRLEELYADIDHKMRELALTISHEKAGDDAGALAIMKTNEGRDVMLRIRSKSAAFDEAEIETLTSRQSSVALQRTLLLSIIIMAVLVAGVLAYFVWREPGISRRSSLIATRRCDGRSSSAVERRPSSGKLKRWRRSDSSPGALPMISTTC